MSEQERAYTFPPLERRGWVGSLSKPQVVLLAAAAVAAVVALDASGANVTGVMVAVVVAVPLAGLAFWPWRGRPLVEWAPIRAAYARRGLSGERAFRSRAPFRPPVAPAPADGPVGDAARASCVGVGEGPLAGVELWEVRSSQGVVGCLRDGDTFTAAMRARGPGFALHGPAEQRVKLDAWGKAVGQLAADHYDEPLVRRVQMIERTVPGDADAHVRELKRAEEQGRVVPLDSAVASDYFRTLDAWGARRAAEEHVILVALQVDVSRSGKETRAVGDGDARVGGCLLACRELRRLASRLRPTGALVEGQLDPVMLAAECRDTFDPPGRRDRQRWLARARDPRADRRAGSPIATEERPDMLFADGAVHQTFHISQWPQLGVGPAFLAPLLLGSGAPRTFSVTLRPVAGRASTSAVEDARVHDETERARRRKLGVIETERQRRQRAAAARREAELAAGWREVDYTGFVSVSGRTVEELERRRSQVIARAGECGLQLELLYWQQEAALCCTLPLCWGLADD
jgi:hypothetical protein